MSFAFCESLHVSYLIVKKNLEFDKFQTADNSYSITTIVESCEIAFVAEEFLFLCFCFLVWFYVWFYVCFYMSLLGEKY